MYKVGSVFPRYIRCIYLIGKPLLGPLGSPIPYSYITIYLGFI